MPYVDFENGDSLLEIRNKLNAAIAANEQAAANALSRANHTGTQAKSTITDLESDLSGLQAGIDAINALLGDEAGDGNSAVDTLREALVILQNFSEGADVAQLITDAQSDVDKLKPVTFTIASDTPELTFDKRKSMTSPYTPTGNFSFNVAASGNIDDSVLDFELVLDGTKTITFPSECVYFAGIVSDYLNTETKVATLPAGTYKIYLVYQNGEINVSSLGNKIVTGADVTSPTVAITSSESGTTSTTPIPITITFSESVTGFAVGDLTIGNGTAGNFAGSGTTYTADITPTGDGAVTVDIAQGVAQDAAGNTNDAASQFSITYSSGGGASVEITWTSLSSAQQEANGGMSRTAGDSDWTAGGRSTRVIDVTQGNNEVIFRANTNLADRILVGLNDDDAYTTDNDIDFAIFLVSGQTNIRTGSGATASNVQAYANGDYFKLAIENYDTTPVVKAYYGGADGSSWTLLHTWVDAVPNTLRVEGAVFYSNSVIESCEFANLDNVA